MKEKNKECPCNTCVGSGRCPEEDYEITQCDNYLKKPRPGECIDCESGGRLSE